MSGLLNSTGAVSGILGSSVLPSGVTGGSGLDETPLSHRNMIINGDMQVAQRGDGTGITNAGSNYYVPDRYKFNEDGTMTAVVTITKETLTSGNAWLDGFNSAWKLDVTTADASVDAAIFTRLTQRFEKDNLARIGKGGASAKTCTLSFWVKATVTGVNVVEFFDQVNTRTSGAQYTINSSDTWEHKTVTFPADTSDPLGTGSGLAAEINFILQVGSNYSSGTGTGTGGVGGAWADSVDANRAAGHACNHFSSTSNNFHLTGIQLELGSNATPFEHRSYGDELRRCQRYYWRMIDGVTQIPLGMGSYYASGEIYGTINFITEMRADPTAEQNTGTDYYQIYRDSASDPFNGFSFRKLCPFGCIYYQGSNVSGTAGQAGWVESRHASAILAFSAEL